MTQIRVLHLMGSLRPSGMERMFVSAAPYFKERGVNSLIVGQGDTHTFLSELRNVGYELTTIPDLRSLGGMVELWRTLKTYKPDLVHIHAESAFAVSTMVIRLAVNVPIIRTVHNVFQPSGRARLSRVLQAHIADRLVAKFIAPSPDVAQNELSFGRPTVTIANWVADEYTDQDSEVDPRLAVMVGNCSSIKNHEMALRSLVKGGYKVAHHGDERYASTEEVALLDLLESQDDLLHRGSSSPLESLKRASLFVMPSTREGMPVALGEALSMGVPCLVADSPGLGWARGIDGVEHLPLNQELWDNALPRSGYIPQTGVLKAPDFSANRGVQEYTEQYISLLNIDLAVQAPSTGDLR